MVYVSVSMIFQEPPPVCNGCVPTPHLSLNDTSSAALSQLFQSPINNRFPACLALSLEFVNQMKNLSGRNATSEIHNLVPARVTTSENVDVPFFVFFGFEQTLL